MLKSLPSRERGLKSFAWESNKLVNTSLPSRERGLKFMNHIFIKIEKTVAPLAGAWIEISRRSVHLPVAQPSLPSRERGLKSLPACFCDTIPQSLPSRERGLK